MSADTTMTGPWQAMVGRDVIEASGPDAATFLQGQLSQDVAALAVGAGAYSLLLQPQGKVDAWLRVNRVGDERFLLDVDAGWGEAVVRRLARFKLRTRCELTVLEGLVCWAVRGSDDVALGLLRDRAVAAGDGAVVVAAGWPAASGFDRLGPRLGALDGVPIVVDDAYTAARIEAGVPAMGAELDESTIPAEAGPWLIDRSVSFTKGCYTGQELVARVDSRGSNTPRKLRLGRASGGLVAGMALSLDGEPVGTVTSAAAGGSTALVYVRRAVEVPVVLTGPDGVRVDVGRLPGG